ncbi:hypothetical protein L6452_33146 [Arctium lappa]|uniref:Uncharacterized protein n=1 Tax=Arctium lappa TaxID=4217 RepID=A0ACB8Z6X3_ARCLA|nr:hypothetical protein L6452_33146 [Arctium lappa]
MPQPPEQYSNYAYISNARQAGNFPGPSYDFQGMSCNTNRPRPGSYHGPGSVGLPSPDPHFSHNSSHVLVQGGYPSPRPHYSRDLDSGSGQDGYPTPRPHFSCGPNRGSGQGGYPSPGPHFSSGPGRGSGQGSYPSPGPHFRNSLNHVSGQVGYPALVLIKADGTGSGIARAKAQVLGEAGVGG